MAIAVYEDVATGRHHFADPGSATTVARLEAGLWVLFDDTPTTPPPNLDPLGAAMTERTAPDQPFGVALRAFLESRIDRSGASAGQVPVLQADGETMAFGTVADGGGGVTDHGALTGLADDDHPQYLNEFRGDARYAQGAHTHPVGDLTATGTPSDSTFLRGDGTWAAPAGEGGGVTDHSALTGRTAADSHPIAAITGLQGALDGKQPAGSYATPTDVTTASTADRARANHTGTQSLDTTTDSATRLAMTTGERTKLAGVATAATANATDAQLRDRSTHTGSQPASTISDSSAVGRSVLTATDAAAARSAIGAGTSNLALGTTSSTAKAGDYTPPADAAAGTASMRTLGTGAQQAKPGDWAPPAATDGATAATVVRTSKVAGDTTNRFERRADGTVSIGPGDTIPLRTDGFISLDMGAEPTREGIWIRASSYPDLMSQPLLIVDANEAPIFGVGKAGGASIFGDNFNVYDGGDIFNPEIRLRANGTVQARRGDAAGGAGVFALGNASAAPTAQPDGTHTVEGASTVPGVVFYAKGGRAYVVDGGGVPQEITGGSANVRSITVQKDIGLATLSSIGVPAAAVSGTGTGNTSTNSDNQFVAPFLALTTAATANNAQGVTPSTYSQLLPPFRPMMWTKIRTGSAITSTRYWVGMFSANPGAVASPTALHCAAFRYDTSVDGTAFWRCVTSAASATPTVTTTSVAAAVDTTYNMRIEINASNNSVRFLIDDVVVATHTATLPTAAMAPDVRVTTLSAAARTLHFSRYTVTQLG